MGTLGDALKDLGWFPFVLATVVGAPSLLVLWETIFVDHRLIDGLQAIVDLYHRVMTAVGAIVEPWLRPGVAWLSQQIGISLTLDPIWRPIFTLGVMLTVGFVRGSSAGNTDTFLDTFAFAATLILGAFVGAIAVGLMPIVQVWWIQGAVAALPILSQFFAFSILGAGSVIEHGMGAVLREFFENNRMGLQIAAMAFVAGAGLSLLPVVGPRAGVLAFGLYVAAMGVGSLRVGLRLGRVPSTRIGLVTLGGFFVAGIVLVADLAIKLTNQS